MVNKFKIKFYQFLSMYHFEKANKHADLYKSHRELGKIFKRKCAVTFNCGCGREYDLNDYKYCTSLRCKCGRYIVLQIKY